MALLALVVGACRGPGGEVAPPPSTPVPETSPASVTTVPTVSTTAPPPTTVAAPSTTIGTSAWADLVVPLDDARYRPPGEGALQPIALTIDRLGVDDAPVVPVGVRDDGSMEIPGVTDVGWYRFSSLPGNPGSSVLVAHIAYGGEAGVFRHLADLGPGDEVEVGLADGGVETFVVTERAQYPKEELPDDRIFTATGPPSLTLITCGGAFDRSARSYQDNVVVYAEPVR